MGEGGLRDLVERVAAFHLTDRAMVRAQKAVETALRKGEPSRADVRAYLAAVRRYFGGFERDAREELTSVDRELGRLYQRQYNLTAERGVAVKRIEAVEGVLALLAELATP